MTTVTEGAGTAARGDDARTSFEVAGARPDDAVRLYEDAYDGTGFAADDTDRAFSYRFRVVGDDTMSFRSTRFDGRMRGEVEVRDEYVVMWTSEGGGLVDVGRDEVLLGPRMPMMFPTGRPFVFDLADLRQSLVQFGRDWLEGVAAEVHGVQPGRIRFDHARRPDAGALAAWDAQVRSAASIVLGPRPVTPLVLAETARETARALLATFEHTVASPEVVLPQGATGRVAQAVEYMHASAHLPITTTDVAAHVGLSVRGLQQAFQRQVGTAPNTLLRGIRLDRVQEELRAAVPGQVTVAAVAQRWGFAHLGRFSGAYAARFGEYPRETLHR